ncbi:hypothetical protein TGAM01_v201568 [Trichoderma gamsii]|uniref:Uncharacterized protein n=1 Tax=Trichoderma gamsii TaxID=398673 RepID=A0A2P4ZYD3_9HYPO|nr:hypothetical protein TGAM01_v201568 [Trichoderma gamsii]PON29319.1 hypothetical protein TGAM01_v201568 [Trichoderma gamsii]
MEWPRIPQAWGWTGRRTGHQGERAQLASTGLYSVPSPARLGPTSSSIDRLADCSKEADAARQRISGHCIPCCGAGLRPPKVPDVFTASFNLVLGSFEASAAADVQDTPCMPTSNASDLPLAASRGRLEVMHLAVLVPEIPGANGAIGRSRPTPSGFACAPAQQAGICFVTLASQSADSRRWRMAHWPFLLPRALPSSPHLSPLALWRPEALAQWNGDSLGPSPPLSIGAISAVMLRCRPAAGTVPSTAAVPLLVAATRPCASVCWPLSLALLAPDCHRHLSGTGYVVFPALLASQYYPDVAETLP